jgi:hypothetical protein
MSYPRRKIIGRGFQYELYKKRRSKIGKETGKFYKYPVLFLECGHYVVLLGGYLPKHWTTCYDCGIIARFWNIITGGTYIKQQVMREPFYEGDNPRNYFGTVGKYTDFAEHVTDFKIMWE